MEQNGRGNRKEGVWFETSNYHNMKSGKMQPGQCSGSTVSSRMQAQSIFYSSILGMLAFCPSACYLVLQIPEYMSTI